MKRAASIVSLLGIALLTVISGQSDAEQDVLKLHREYEDGISRRDASVHERLFADDYTYTLGNGDFMDKARHIAFTKSGAVNVSSLRSEDLSVRVYGDAAVVTGRWVVEGARGGRPIDARARYLIVYIKRNGRWQIVAESRSAPTQ